MHKNMLTLTLTCCGLAASAFADGRLETVRNKFNIVQQKYDDLKQNLEKGATDDAKESAKQLSDAKSDMAAYIVDIWDRCQGIPALKEIWDNVTRGPGNLGANLLPLIEHLGKQDVRDDFAKVTENFLKLGDDLKAAYDRFKDFGQKWLVICDSCH